LLVKHYNDAWKALSNHTTPKPNEQLLTLLKGLRAETDPVLTIGFEDATAPELEPRSQAFAPERCERRERIVLEALRQALQPRLRDLLAVERAPVSDAHLRLTYRITPGTRPEDAELSSAYQIEYKFTLYLRQAEVGEERWEALPETRTQILSRDGEPHWAP